MGMFDTVHFECPKCGHAIEEQSKVGPLDLKDFQASAVPLAIADSLDGESVFCPGCDTEWRISCGPIKHVALTLESLGEDD
jgi:uncharacterized C2H2 Zn-finger protein